jgi:MbtH protein
MVEIEHQYKVVVNAEEQYSIWLSDEPLPSGWLDTGATGTEDECLAHIECVWVDMRPASLRRALAETKAVGWAEG